MIITNENFDFLPVEVKDVNEYMKDHIFELRRKI